MNNNNIILYSIIQHNGHHRDHHHSLHIRTIRQSIYEMLALNFPFFTMCTTILITLQNSFYDHAICPRSLYCKTTAPSLTQCSAVSHFIVYHYGYYLWRGQHCTHYNQCINTEYCIEFLIVIHYSIHTSCQNCYNFTI